MNRALVLSIAVLTVGACSKATRTVVVGPNPEVSRTEPSTITMGVPPGHLPEIGECRIWIPGTAPGRQPKPKSRPCAGIGSNAPPGSWVLYRESRRLVYRREVDGRQAGLIVRTRIFDIETTRLVREEGP